MRPDTSSWGLGARVGSSPPGRRDLLIAVVISLTAVAFGGLRTAWGVIGAYHDDGLYVACGKALAEGRGYVIPTLPVALPQTKYPPLLPAVFALIWKLAPAFPRNAILFQGFCLLCQALAAGLSYLCLVRFQYASRRAALAAVAVTISSPEYLLYGTMPLSEGPFSLLAVLSFLGLESLVGDAANTRRRAVWTGLLAALAVLCRTLGGAFLAVGAVFLWRKRREALAPFLLASAPPVLAWVAWSGHMRPSDLSPMLAYYVDYGADWIDVTLRDVPRILGLNVFWTIRGLGVMLIPGMLIFLGLVLVPLTWLGLGVGALFLLRMRLLLRGARLLPWLLIAYFIPVILHPWPPERFWIPFLPLAAGLFAAQTENLWRRVWPARMRVALDLAIVAIVLNLVFLMMNFSSIRRYRYPVMLAKGPPHWSSLQEGFAWIRTHTKPGTVVAAGLDPMVWLYTGRPSFRYYVQRPLNLFYDDSRPALEKPEILMANLRRFDVGYLFEAPQYGFKIDERLRTRIREIAARHPSPFRMVFESRDGKVRIYRIDHGAEPTLGVTPVERGSEVTDP